MFKDNVNISRFEPLLSPLELKSKLPMSGQAAESVTRHRKLIQNIMDKKLDKFIAIVGPCSIHSVDEALEYARKLYDLSRKIEDKIFTIMRVYFEKPRTTIGWKGLIYDPELNESCNMAAGLDRARRLLLKIDEIGLATATEILDPVTAQYIADLITWAAIGARTTESQTHRQLASGLSMPVGFKNTTDGSIKTAVEAIQSAVHNHAFLGLLEDGRSGIFHTKGNQYAHIVLRGGANGPNYTSEYIAYTRELLKRMKLKENIIVDCSHANSNKDAFRQKDVLNDIVKQKIAGEKSIIGAMIESNLIHGKQNHSSKVKLQYGVSITDECLGWDDTEALLLSIHSKL